MCYWKKKQEGFRSSVKSGRPFCEKVFFQCSPRPLCIHARTHTHTSARTSCTRRLPWVLGSIFSGPLRHPVAVAAPPRDSTGTGTAPPHVPATDRFVYCQRSAAGSGGEPSALCLCVCAREPVCVCLCACVRNESRGDEAAGRPCSHTGGSQSTAPLQCSVGLRAVLLRVVHVATAAAAAATFAQNLRIILFYCFNFSFTKYFYKYPLARRQISHTATGILCVRVCCIFNYRCVNLVRYHLVYVIILFVLCGVVCASIARFCAI